MMGTKKQRLAEDEAFDRARRAILYNEQPPKPPTEVELLRRDVRELEARLKLAAEVLAGEHECGDDW